ncbi:MAG: hypothetical protein GKS05_09420 [Nitrospirales bacterium]|nr:hypothetical protein [Nitrospirales bacterium]
MVYECLLMGMLLAGLPIKLIDHRATGCCQQTTVTYREHGLSIHIGLPNKSTHYRIKIPYLFQNADFLYCQGKPTARIGSTIFAVEIQRDEVRV